jgi:hypothetical protein
MVRLGMLGAAAFEKGGAVPSDHTLAILHAHEMVLPSHISTGLQQMISNNSSTSIGPSSQVSHVNMENDFHKPGDLSETTITTMMHKAIRRGSFPRRRN